ncbi:MAG: phospholipase [Gemmatimonadaceae bacterium]
MIEHHISVTRTARYVTLGPSHGAVSQVWFACHGYGQLVADFARNFAPIDDGSRLIVLPEALSRFYTDQTTGRHGAHAKVGATWMTREDRLAEIGDYVTYLDALYDAVFAERDRARVEVVALGFSQGVASVTRWLARGRARADRLIVWGGSIPAELVTHERHALHATPLTFVLGSRDELATEGVRAEHRGQLDAAGFRYEVVGFEGGHRMDNVTLATLASQNESRRDKNTL